MRLDTYNHFPTGMIEYLDTYGWHFSKAMCDWAISKMHKENNKPIDVISKERVDSLLSIYGIKLDNNKGYDYVYIANMVMSDFYGKSIKDEEHLILYVKDVIDDVDAYEGMPFTRFYADCIGSGTPIIWEDML